MGISTSEPTGTPRELESEVRDRDCFFAAASASAACRVDLEHSVNRSDGRLLEYFTVEGTGPDRVLSIAEDAPAIDRARLIGRGVDGGLFEFVVSGPCVTTTLADTGAIATAVSADAGVGHVDVRRVVERFRDGHANAELTACRDAGSVRRHRPGSATPTRPDDTGPVRRRRHGPTTAARATLSHRGVGSRPCYRGRRAASPLLKRRCSVSVRPHGRQPACRTWLVRT